jgi:hypothetical protein
MVRWFEKGGEMWDSMSMERPIEFSENIRKLNSDDWYFFVILENDNQVRKRAVCAASYEFVCANYQCNPELWKTDLINKIKSKEVILTFEKPIFAEAIGDSSALVNQIRSNFFSD